MKTKRESWAWITTRAGRYQGLKRHLLLTAVSHLFLVKVHQELRGGKPGVDGVSGANRDVGSGEGPVAVGPVCDAMA